MNYDIHITFVDQPATEWEGTVIPRCTFYRAAVMRWPHGGDPEMKTYRSALIDLWEDPSSEPTRMMDPGAALAGVLDVVRDLCKQP